MARLFRSSTSLASSPRASIPSRSSTVSAASSTPRKSTLLSDPRTTSQNTSESSSLLRTSIHAQWVDGLTQYMDFHLHNALSTFKRLLRDLRIDEDDLPSPTTTNHSYIGSTPYRILSPAEVALLYVNIALIHGYLGSYYLSAAAFEEALLLDDTSGIAWFGLGIARFYLRELGASKRAFGKCQACFVVEDENGSKQQRDELIYNVWPGTSELGHGSVVAERSSGPEGTLDPWHPFRGVLARTFFDRSWALERPRVEWNWRIALFERNYVRKGLERPGGGKWGLNGIPAGIVFGPDTHVSNAAIETHRITDNQFNNKGSELITTAHHVWTGSLVRQKLSLLQQKVLRKKPSAVVSPVSPMRTKCSESSTSSNDLKDNLASTEDAIFPRNMMAAGASSNNRGILRTSTSLAIPKTLYRAHSLNEDNPKTQEAYSQSDAGTKESDSLVPMFPPRRSSLTPPSTRKSYAAHRPFRYSGAATDIAFQEFKSIEEDPIEDQFRDPWIEEAAVSENAGRNAEGCSPKDTRGLLPSSNNPSSYSSITSGKVGNVIPRNLMPDFHIIPALTNIQIPQTATSSRYGSDSFMTDDISPLSSRMRSGMFPSFSDWHSPSSRRPSYATDVWNASSDTVGSEEYDDRDSRRPSAIVTLTPATPERSGGLPPTPANLLDDLVDTYYMTSDFYSLARPLSLKECLDDDNANVEPLKATKKERMSITGRTCLGEWEWEAEYERWRQEESSAMAMDSDDDDDDTVGEMLKPQRFEGCDIR
ncbi:MAG: hypothetical protein Q9170_006672 [Blastenia crenularia]